MSSLTDKVDQLFAKWNRPDSPGCSLAIIKDGDIIYKRGYGMADLERNIPLKPDSVFDIGSVGKQFTAMLIAILARQGALRLEDSVINHIPELPEYAQQVTIRHLIHHISGLRDYTALLYFSGRHIDNFYYEEELLDLICRQKGLNFTPGDKFEYSNTNYLLLGVIARQVTGKSLPVLFQEYILDPLGMRSTSFNDNAGRIIKNRAIGYSTQGDGYRNDMSFNGGFGDGMILTTVEDLFLWDQNFYHNKLGNGGNELIREVLTQGVFNSGERLSYAFGLWVDTYRGLRRIGHPGEWAGYRSDYLQFPDQNFSVICLANLSIIEPRNLTEKVASLYLEDLFTEVEPLADQKVTQKLHEISSILISPAQSNEYAGIYYSEELNACYQILPDGERLCFRRGYSARETLQPVALDFFQAGDSHFLFERDEHKLICAFQLSSGMIKAIRFNRRG